MDDQTLRHILQENRTIAVVGLSDKPHRASYDVAKYLVGHGYKIIPVNPNLKEVLKQKCYPSLREIPEKIDLVDCFRRSEAILPIAEDAIAIGAKVLWMQMGMVNQTAADKATAAGLQVIMNRCIKIEHLRLAHMTR